MPTLQIASSITEFVAVEWNTLIPGDEPHLRYEFLRAVEKSSMVQDAVYLAARGSLPAIESAPLLGIAVIYRIDIDLLVFASPKLTRVAGIIRKGPLKRFLILRALSCGPAINNCRANLYVAPDLDAARSTEIVNQFAKALDEITGGSLQVLFEFNAEQEARFGSALTKAGYLRGDSLPGTQLDIDWPDLTTYMGAMRKFYRRAIRHDLKATANLEIKTESHFSDLASEAFALYENVVARAQFVFGKLTPAFFEELGQLDQARLVTIREKTSNKLVGIELLLMGTTVLQDLYTGLDYGVNDEYSLYFNLIYPVIAYACLQGMRFISMGQTSYAFKSRLGIKSYPLYVFVKHRNPIVQWILRRCHKLLFPNVQVPTHRVFREDDPLGGPEASSGIAA